MTVLQSVHSRVMSRTFKPVYAKQQRFDPNSYRPAARWETRREESALIIDEAQVFDLDPDSEPERVEAPSRECCPTTRSVTALSLALDKTELDEEETRAFLEFEKEAAKDKTPYRRRVRMLPTSGRTGPK